MSMWIWWNDCGGMLGKEETLMNYYTALSLWGGKDYEHAPEDFIFINTANDLELVDVQDEYSLPKGNECITDRNKLTQVLRMLADGAEYKYIFLDILMDKQYVTPYDSALVDVINTTPRLVYAAGNSPELDGISQSKRGCAEYSTTIVNSDFCQYRLMSGKTPSMAYKAYLDLFPGKSWRVNNNFMPVLSFNQANKYDDDGRVRIYNLGVDILDVESDFCEYVKDKYIFIGAFGSDDVHDTYLGVMDGIQIHANAFACMLEGSHVYPVWVFIVMTLVVMMFYIVVFIYKRNITKHLANFCSKLPGSNKLKIMLGRKWIKVLLSFVSFEIFFTCLFYFFYLTTHRIIEVTSLSLLFTLIWNMPSWTIIKIRITNAYIIMKKFVKKVGKWNCTMILIAVAFFIGIYAEAYAEDYRILYISTPNYITIDGVRKNVGDTISSESIIEWRNNKQGMRVESILDKSRKVISKKQASTTGGLTLKSYLKSDKTMAHRDGILNSPEAIRVALPDTMVLLDKIEIANSVKQDETHFFFLEYEMDGELIRKKLQPCEGYLTIDRGIYIVDGNINRPFSTLINLYYYDAERNFIKIIGENIYIDIHDL